MTTVSAVCNEADAKLRFVEAALDAFYVSRGRDDKWRSQFDRSKFFRTWFRNNRNAYVFVFKESLEITNIQVAELMALVCQYSFHDERHTLAGQSLWFNSQDDFYEAINQFVAPLFDWDINPDNDIGERGEPKNKARDKIRDHINLVEKHYWDVIKTSVVIEIYNGSCVLFLPPHVSIDLTKICAASGYIFSCGELIYVRNALKAEYDVLLDELNQNLAQLPKDTVVPFRIHSVEAFPHSTDDDPDLPHLKIYERKAVFAGYQFPELLQKLPKGNL